MPLETTTFINGLDANNPAAGDTVGQADDHIRLIKASVKATFPNITGAVTPTHTVINAVPGRLDALEARPDGILGEIRMYGGAAAPSKWLLCQGQTVSRTTYAALFAVLGTAYGSGDGSTTFRIPDLRDRFPKGANGNLGTSGGSTSATTSSAGSHSHGGTTGGTALTLAQMPSHTHTGTTNNTALTGTFGPFRQALNSPDASATGVFSLGSEFGSADAANGSRTTRSINMDASHTHTFTTNATGEGAAHTHSIGSDGAHTHTVTVDPPFVSVNFMIFAGV